jgi:septum formation protein
MSGPRLILASRSPQRRAILEQLGVPFEIRVSGAEELTGGIAPRVLVAANAERKARAVADESAGSGLPVLGVDTIVLLRGRVYGKPENRNAAIATISSLAGCTHTVISGLCVVSADGGSVRAGTAETEVVFRVLNEAEVEEYVDTGEWRDRAGGYAIQGRGALLVSEIHGDYLNVVGLPVAELVRVAPELF